MTPAKNPCWAWTDTERLQIESRHRSLIGVTFVEVSYVAPAAARVADRSQSLAFDATDVGVEFRDLDGQPTSAVWRMEGFNEGLAFGPGTAEELHGLYAVRQTDVSDTQNWNARLGRSVVDVRTAWHVPNEGCPQAVWAIQLIFDGGSQAMLALGQPNGRTGFEYQPDEIVVIFDAALSREYRVPGDVTVAGPE